ncbi:hypothetical protein H6P81_001798 [Aristolochia fimbriata]|uniref:Thioredoxin domain-containing protein n=1 Tax=Aristolochia fimbriata TaxID=158543 RepID=A0AAV7F7W4_ARIFI|nr:hypothetical protein H6P81_001798 [Aristolochia fimbriata]
MAAGACTVQVSSVVTTSRGSLLQPPGSNGLLFSSYKKRLNLPTCRGLKIATLSSLPSSSSSIARRSSKVLCQARTDEVLVVTDSSWQNLVIGSQNPVLVEFWAPWCGPCRMIAPVINELAKEYAGKIVCCKVNTDDCPSIATQYGIRSIPTVLIFKDGEKRESVIGAVPKSTLTDTLEKIWLQFQAKVHFESNVVDDKFKKTMNCEISFLSWSISEIDTDWKKAQLDICIG